ncbi:hypothetical protein N657DRAFT_675813 [Parathielavia appendiculata]|uniref:Uncharacterized protein n=1 Tax=Parathielavia appendiculata TaxID=2587402 RepID=A0AAN6TP39_9PEZI|nr:hypothetical protein N657DRAFT_675813 [Parathielavia appendiculata]
MLGKANAAFLLQAAALISGAAARCVRTCPADDPLLNLLRSEDAASKFCRGFLGLEASTVDVTVTPTVVATVTETAHVTDVVTEVDETITVTVPAGDAPATTASVIISTILPGKRDDVYPTWLPASYGASYVSKACSCLSLAPSVVTVTSTAEQVTVTSDAVTVTEVETSTLHTTAVATATAAPAPVTYQRKIQVFRKDSGAFLGWLYDSNGVAVAEDMNFGDRNAKSRALDFGFSLPAGATTGSQMRVTGSGGALGFLKDSHPQNIVQLEAGYGSLAWVTPTPPGSVPRTMITNQHYAYESDIWIVNLETGELSWRWISNTGALSNIPLYKLGGRLYPVGNIAQYNYATSGSPAPKYEVILKVYTEAVPQTQ